MQPESSVPTPRAGLGARLASTARNWWQEAVLSRLRTLRIVPTAGAPLVIGIVLLNLVLGLLPVVFIIATSVMIGRVPAAVQAGLGSADWDELVLAFVVAAAAFFVQQVLAPLQAAIGELLRRRVDGAVRDRLIEVTTRHAGISVLEDPEALDQLAETTRYIDRDWATPGGAAAGMLALIARYSRLVALVVIVGAVVHWAAALAVLAVTLLFRYGQRGGTRIYSRVWREVLPDIRRSEYFLDTAMEAGAAKELRVFGLVGWINERYAESFRRMFGRVAKRRREIYFFPYLAYTAVGLLVSIVVMLLVVQDGLAAPGDLGTLALALQCVVAAVLLGEYYPEADVETQFGIQAVDALERLRLRADAVAAGAIQTADASDAAAGAAASAAMGAGAAGRGADAAAAPAKRARAKRVDGALELRFEGVRFGYPGSERLVLDGLDLELPAGRSTAVVGVNGAGKTTTVKLLTRLYEPSAGRVLADGVDIAGLPVEQWRRQVSVIFQDFVRYELSAADNIAFGAVHTPPEPEALLAAAERAGIAEVLTALPNGLDTVLSRGYEGGVDLSGGQWQRVAIARSLYALSRGARVLVLDEPTSAMDVRAEAAFFDRFVALTEGVTSLLISHRFSSVRRADRIVVIEGGRVSEQGSHTALMKADGHYARLFRLQAERFARGLDAEGNRVEAGGDADDEEVR